MVFAIHWHESAWVHMCPPSWTTIPVSFPSHPIFQGCPSAPAGPVHQLWVPCFMHLKPYSTPILQIRKLKLRELSSSPKSMLWPVAPSWPQLPHYCSKWGKKDSYPNWWGWGVLEGFRAQPQGVLRADPSKTELFYLLESASFSPVDKQMQT